MKTILSLTIFLVVFAFSGAEYPELSEGTMTASVRIARKFSRQQAKVETRFWLYTQKNREVEEGQLLKINDMNLLNNSNFDISRPVRILIHGFLNKKDSDFNKNITKAYLNKGNFNVIVFDWGDLSKTSTISYLGVAESIKHLAPVVGQFALFLNRIGVPFENMYLIGHSLGAHIAGMAGQSVKPHQFHVIFGLDPAGPEFHDIHIDHRLDKNDAYYVESIQTNIVQLQTPRLLNFAQKFINSLTTYGYYGALGNASFFPNYGAKQPGCPRDATCSHARAYLYFAESIERDEPFYGRECRNFDEVIYKYCTGTKRHVIMGGEPAHTGRGGLFFVRTGDQSPYSVKQLDPSNYVDMSVTPAKSRSIQATRILICDNSRNDGTSGVEDCEKLKKAYSEKNVNIILVNWGKAFKDDLMYDEFTMEDIAHVVANKLRELHQAGISYDQIYLIGVKKGVEIAYKAAEEIAPERINTLFALDYAERFNKTPFKYVESITDEFQDLGKFHDNGDKNVYIRKFRTTIDTFVNTITQKDKNMAYVCENEAIKVIDVVYTLCVRNRNLMAFGGEPANQIRPEKKLFLRRD